MQVTLLSGAVKNTYMLPYLHTYGLQLALQEIQAWTNTWLLVINEKKEKKTTYTVFSLSNLQPKVKLKINSQPLKADESLTYLGVTLDRRLTLEKSD